MDIRIILGLTLCYFIAILGFVVFARYKTTKSLMPSISEFFLASKDLNPIILACTYAASLFSTFSILGLPALIYAHGISSIYFIAITDALGLTLLIIIGKRLHRMGQEKRMFSPIEAISENYNCQRLGCIVAAIFTLALLPYISLQLVGIGAFIDSYSGGRIDYLTGVGAMMTIVLLYLFLGGMRAVAYTDFIQLIAMVFGLLAGALFLTHHYDINVAAMFSDLQQTSPLHFMAPGAKDYFHLPMILSMAIVTAGVFIQPHLLTRALMARKESHINIMALGTVIGRVVTTALAIFIGVFAYVTYGGDLKPNLVMGEVFRDLGGLGLIGLIISVFMLMGALGAAMSTADSLLISIGQISTRDIIRPFFKLSSKHQVLLSKAIMSAILVFSFLIGLNPPKYMTDLAIYSGAISAILVPTFLSFTWKHRSLLAAYSSTLIGAAALCILTILKLNGIFEIKSIHVGLLPTLASFAVYYSVALLFRKTPASQLSPAP
jgi:SSS family solute:Na+ symporter